MAAKLMMLVPYRASLLKEDGFFYFFILNKIMFHSFNLPKKYSSALTALVVILNTIEWSKYCNEGNVRVIQVNCTQ